jgi:thiamine transport system permease protein
MRRGSTELYLLAAVLAVVGAFALLPAGELFARSVSASGGLGAISAVFASPPNHLALSNSLVQGGVSAALAVAVGYPAGVFVGRYRWPGRGTVRSALLLPFLLPSLVMILGVLDLFGPTGLVGGPLPAARWFASGLPGIVTVNLFYNVPIVVVLTATGCEASSSALEESVASLGGSPARGYLEAWARPSWVGAACGGLLTFVFSALSFAPPILLCGSRCNTVEDVVYQLAEVSGQPAAAGVLALVLVALFLAPALVYVLLVRRLRPSRGRTARPRPPSWRAAGTWALAATFVAVVAAELALVLAVVVRSVVPAGGGPLGQGWTLLASPATAARLGISLEGAVGNTLFFAGLAAGVGIVLATASSFVTARHPRLAAALGIVLFVPVLLSPVVLAEALSTFWQPLLGGSADVWVLIVLSQALLGLPFAVQSLEIPLAGLPRSGAESAESLGASSWGAFVDAELPRVRRGLQTALLFAFALGLGEFTATYFLVTPQSRFRTLPVAVYALTNDRLYAAAGAAAALLLALSVVVFALIVASGSDVRE